LHTEEKHSTNSDKILEKYMQESHIETMKAMHAMKINEIIERKIETRAKEVLLKRLR